MKLKFNQHSIKNICDQEDIVYLGLFGSQVRDDSRLESDVDVLIDFEQPKSFFQLAKVQEKLEKVFGKKVDLVLRTNIKDELKPQISKDLLTIYG